MNGWTVPIQHASFKGVRFDVLSVDDTFEQALVEHSYPFINGADLECMGFNPENVTLKAILYGEGYFVDYQKFLNLMQDSSKGLLVHPVRGRMQDMVLYSARLSHEADNIDYVALDLSFKKTGKPQPIFVFSSVISKIDSLLLQIEEFEDNLTALFASYMQIVSFAFNSKTRLLNVWGALFGCAQQVVDLFNFAEDDFSLIKINDDFVSLDSIFNKSIHKAEFKDISTQAISVIHKMIDSNITAISKQPCLTVISNFNDVCRAIDDVLKIPQQLVNFGNESVENKRTSLRSLSSSLSENDVKELTCAVHLSCSIALSKVVVNIFEQHSENLIPSEVEVITTALRLNLVKTLNVIRYLQNETEKTSSLTAGQLNTANYSLSHKTGESIRNIASEIMELAILTINKKPPMIIKECKINGTLQQVSHLFYGDYRRSGELLRLNPQIRQPNFIKQGTLLNCYSK